MSRLLSAGPELDQLLAELALQEHEPDERRDAWLSGSRRFLMQPHQLGLYDAFHEWNAYRQTDAYADWVEQIGAQYDDAFMNYAGRRVGKTSETILMLDEHAHMLVLAGLVRCAVLTYFTAFEKDIGEIIVPLYEQLTEDCPRELRAEYAGKRGAIGKALYYPNGSYIKLVGVDKNPDGLRGRFSDGMAGSEVAFMKTSLLGRGLNYVVKSVLLPQFQRRPWAFLILETSAPEDPEHDVLTTFRPDCEARGAFHERTLDDNTSISEREYKKAIREAGGRGDPDCEREFFNVTSRDINLYVVPEFNEDVHVVEGARPQHAVGLVSADPGVSDMHAFVFGHYDFERAKGVIEWSWAKRNSSTRECACVQAYAEWKLWGRWPHFKMSTIPVHGNDAAQGWVELLRSLIPPVGRKAEGVSVGSLAIDPTELEDVATELARMAAMPMDDERRAPERWRRTVPAGHFGFWDGHALVQNPRSRVSDVDLRFVGDIWTDFGSNYTVTAKDNVKAQISAVRNAFGGGELEIWKGAGPVIAHVKNAIKDEKKYNDNGRGRGWKSHPKYGHYDCLAALIYWWRNLDRQRNPNPPAHVTASADHFVPQHAKREPTAAERFLGAGMQRAGGFGGGVGRNSSAINIGARRRGIRIGR